MNNKKITMIGCGKLGLPCAEVMSSLYDVIGYDIFIQSSSIRMVTTIEEAVKNRDIIFIALPTPYSDKRYSGNIPSSNLSPIDFDYSIIEHILIEINRFVNNNQLVVLISTVLTGTLRERLSKYLTNSTLIYNPYLIALGSVKFDMTHPDMLIIGTESGNPLDKKIQELLNFYKPLIIKSCHKMIGTWEEAETTKLFYNVIVSSKINMVNMIQDIAEKNGNINVDKITDALSNSTDRIISSKYMIAGLGSSGPCLPRDNVVINYLSKKLNLGYELSQVNVREQQAKNIATKLIQLSDGYKMPIVIHGRTYKPNLLYIDGSYSELIGYYLQEFNKKFYYVDPLTNDIFNSDLPCVYFMAHNPYFLFDESKNINLKLYCKISNGSVILDPWRKFPYNTDYKVIYYGSYKK